MASSMISSRKLMYTCMYKDCSNNRKDGHHLYYFPKSDNPLCAQWIARAGEYMISIYIFHSFGPCIRPAKVKQFYITGICAEHFSPEMFRTESSSRPNIRPRLKASAVPKPWENEGQCREEEELRQVIAGYHVEEEEPQIIEGCNAGEEQSEFVEGYTVEEEDVEIIKGCIAGEEQSEFVEGYTVEEEDVEIIEGCNTEQDNGHERGTEDIVTSEEDYNVHVPTKVYGKTTLYFSETEDDRMDWVDIEPSTSYLPRKTRTPKNPTIAEDKIATRLQKMNRTLRRKITDLKLALKCNKQKLQRAMAAKVRVSKAAETVDEFLDRQKCVNKASRTMVKLQLKKHNAPYTTDEQDLAKMIFYHSPSAYNRLRKSGCHLPAESTVRKWIAINNLNTGFQDHVFENIKRRLSEFPLEQRLCALKWDEMSIKTWEGVVSETP
ncbi:uncharacterized protein LOC143218560 [Lasioglossum baleicum]|uniref:uncharacterized protein LOC143218560 n=1 Tax=Lasioglossum baleicum TaxID=434251 RepID=UPI003FCE4A0C